ncbi:MAG: ribose 5-phosphate isomerase B [Elusimicrobiota bacterium]
MKIAIGSDHAGYKLKEILINFLKEQGFKVIDVGTDNEKKRVDYPDFAVKVSKKIQAKEADRGIIICGSGVGASISANKLKGIRAGLCHDTYSAHQGVEHDDMNVICLGARIIGEELAKEIVLTFIKAKFSNEERYIRRLNKIKKIEGVL